MGSLCSVLSDRFGAISNIFPVTECSLKVRDKEPNVYIHGHSPKNHGCLKLSVILAILVSELHRV